jgi:polyhydroxyalkanoate synthesis regulator phasin
MNDEKEVQAVAEKIVSGGWTEAGDYGDITDEEWTCLRLDIVEALKSHGKSCYERGRKTIEKELMCELRDPNGTIWECATALQKENDSLKERVAELERRMK